MKKTGRLELTWVGKYEEKIIEPRILLEDVSKTYGNPDNGNMLIHGDNLIALQALQQDYAGNRSLTRATSRSIFLPATRSHIIRRMLLTATRSVCSPLFWRKIRMLSVGSSRRLTSLACSGKQVSSIILISSWKQLRENSWSRLRL